MAPGLGAQRGLTAAFSGSSGCLQQFLSIAEIIFFSFKGKIIPLLRGRRGWQWDKHHHPATSSQGSLPPARARCLPPPERKIQGVIRESSHVSHISPGFFGLLCARDSSRSGEPLEQGVQSAAPGALSAFPRKSPAGPQSSALLTPAALWAAQGCWGTHSWGN